MDKNKIEEVIGKFFSSLKSEENKMLETGLTQNQTVDALHLAVLSAIENNEEKFEVFVKWFLNGSMYLKFAILFSLHSSKTLSQNSSNSFFVKLSLSGSI